MGSAWLVFGATHFAFGLPPLRDRLVSRLGEPRFVALFSAVAAASLGLVAAAALLTGGEGPPGTGLHRIPAARHALAILSFLGLTLALAGLAGYPRSPMALFRTRIRPPEGVQRITRHPFFVGFGAFSLAHALLAPTASLAIFFGGFAVVSAIGVPVQDRKLRRKWGPPYEEYLAATSVVPFAGALRGRPTWVREEGVGKRLALGAVLAAAFLALHPWWTSSNGALFAGALAAGGIYAAVRRWTARRVAADTAEAGEATSSRRS